MKKDDSPENSESKSAFYQAGEIIGSIGFHIVDGKDKVIGAIKNKLGKKQAPESKHKKISKKKLAAKAGKKRTGVVKKRSKKASPAKAVTSPVKVVREKADSVKKTVAKGAKGKE